MLDHIIFQVPVEDGSAWHVQSCVRDVRRPQPYYITGKVGNLEIRQYSEYIIIRGSLAKFLHGENMSTLYKSGTIDEVSDSLRKLETETGIRLENGIVKSVEVGTSQIVHESVSEYLRLFGRYGSRFKKQAVTDRDLESVCYFTKSGAYEFKAYDKTQEMNDTGNEKRIPEVCQKQNVIRLEYKIKKRQGIKDKFGRDLNPYDLCDRTVYRKLRELFYDFYKSIPKVGRNMFINATTEITPQDLEKILASQFMQWNPDSFGAVVSQCRDKGILSDRNYRRVQQTERQYKNNCEVSERNDLILELDEKIRSLCK